MPKNQPQPNRCACGQMKPIDQAQCYRCRHTLRCPSPRHDRCPLCQSHYKLKEMSACLACAPQLPVSAAQSRTSEGEPAFLVDALAPADAAWAAGLLLAEGHLSLAVASHSPFPRPIAAVNMRIDEQPVLLELQHILGGDFTLRRRTRYQPQCHWEVANKARVEQVCLLLLRYGRIGRKLQEAQVVLNYITWRQAQGAHPGPAARAEAEMFVRWLEAIKAADDR